MFKPGNCIMSPMIIFSCFAMIFPFIYKYYKKKVIRQNKNYIFCENEVIHLYVLGVYT
jgi:hypothetical protein